MPNFAGIPGPGRGAPVFMYAIDKQQVPMMQFFQPSSPKPCAALLCLFWAFLWPSACQTAPAAKPQPAEQPAAAALAPAPADSLKPGARAKKAATTAKRLPLDSVFQKQGFVDVASLDPSILLDIRYATANNFTKAQIYDCPRCLLRPEAAKAIAKAQKSLQSRGLRLKMFDCYRPKPYQQRLWDKVPDPNYVTPPAKGSMHGRGAAVDLTLVDAQGKELDMGTEYDFFGEKAHSDYAQLPKKVLENRKLLREALEAVGFKGIRTEWWHFSFQGRDYPLDDYLWPCEE
jgi:D-alanyl-D-alanine dipeptidase